METVLIDGTITFCVVAFFAYLFSPMLASR